MDNLKRGLIFILLFMIMFWLLKIYYVIGFYFIIFIIVIGIFLNDLEEDSL